MTYEGVLTKMQTEFGNPIQYYLVFEDSFLNINQLLGKPMEINFVGFQCLNCGKKKKILIVDDSTTNIFLLENLLQFSKNEPVDKDKMHAYAIQNFGKNTIASTFSELYHSSLKKYT